MLKVVVLCTWNENGDVLHKAVVDCRYIYYREPNGNSSVGISCGKDEIIQLPIGMVNKSEWSTDSYCIEEATEELKITEEELLNNYELYYLNSWNGAKVVKVSQLKEIANILLVVPIMWCDEYH